MASDTRAVTERLDHIITLLERLQPPGQAPDRPTVRKKAAAPELSSFWRCARCGEPVPKHPFTRAETHPGCKMKQVDDDSMSHVIPYWELKGLKR